MKGPVSIFTGKRQIHEFNVTFECWVMGNVHFEGLCVNSLSQEKRLYALVIFLWMVCKTNSRRQCWFSRLWAVVFAVNKQTCLSWMCLWARRSGQAGHGTVSFKRTPSLSAPAGPERVQQQRATPREVAARRVGETATAQEVGMFTGWTIAHNALHQHHCWLFLLQTNCKRNRRYQSYT